MLTEPSVQQRIATEAAEEANRLMRKKYKRSAAWSPFIYSWTEIDGGITFELTLLPARNRQKMIDDPDTQRIVREAMHKAIGNNITEVVKDALRRKST